MTASVIVEATLAEVQLEASGNLAFRRGPGLGYNIVGYLTSGQRVRVLGRNADGDRAYIERPETAREYGWVYDGDYATVEGSLDSLETVAAEAAVPAFVRNCTFHPMRILPIDTTLPERFNDPANVRQVNPGTYQAYDQNQEGNPLVFTENVREGQTVDIITDGLGNSYPCP